MGVAKIRIDGEWVDLVGGANSSGANVIIDPDEPTDAPVGTIWYDTDETLGGFSPQTTRSRLLLYDDFSRYVDGSPAGADPLIGENPWLTTGAQLPTITSGKLSSTGSGYIYTQFDAPPRWISADISFTSTSGSWTLALCRYSSILRDILHLDGDEISATLAIRGDDGGFHAIMSPSWTPLKTDGTKYTIALGLIGNIAIFLAPDGRTYATEDWRILEALGSDYDAAYWQASVDCGIHSVEAFTGATTGVHGEMDFYRSLLPSFHASQRITAAPYTPSQVSIGNVGDAAAIVFGPIDGFRAPLSADVAIGATSIVLPFPLVEVATLVLGIGDNEETVTFVSSTFTPPYNITISATTKAHSKGHGVTGTMNSSFMKTISNSSNGFLLPNQTFVNGLLELGTARDAGVQRSAARTVQAMGATGDAGHFRTRADTTANRPSAATVGAGTLYFDTTLNKLITSNGTNWRDGSGTAV